MLVEVNEGGGEDEDGGGNKGLLQARTVYTFTRLHIATYWQIPHSWTSFTPSDIGLRARHLWPCLQDRCLPSELLQQILLLVINKTSVSNVNSEPLAGHTQIN